MGGKTKQSQRTKNNVRPSSSGRSAELLNSAGKLESSFVTAGGSKPLPPLFPTLAAVTLDQGLTPEFSMCVKKLNKKDPITRTKALQELTELINKSNVDEVEALLPSWSHFYKILSIDNDCKVREATQACHGAVARASGRRLGAQLRALLPAWLQAQHDDHAPAQARAQQSLQSTFPENKLPEVITFCKSEIVAHLLDNLTGDSEAMILKRLPDAAAEERALCAARAAAGALGCARAVLRAAPPRTRRALAADLAPLLRDRAFWALASHPHHALRAAWYLAMGSFAEHFGEEFGSTHGARLLRTLLGGGERVVVGPLWDCLLLLMHNHQNWHTWLDKSDLLTKRILDLLESGGWGEARPLSAALAPLLARLPPALAAHRFYTDFFNAIFKGLEKRKILNSKSERQYWITGLTECIKYVSIQENEFVVEVVTCAHRTWLETILSPEQDAQVRSNLLKYSVASMTTLLKYWLKQSKEGNGERYDQLIRNFWQNIGSTLVTQIDKSPPEQDDASRLIDSHILFLQTLKTSFLQEPKKQQSIKFEGDKQEEPETQAIPAPQNDSTDVDRYKHNLNEIVEKVCATYFELADKKNIAEPILLPLTTLLKEFDSEETFIAIARYQGVNSVYEFYDKVLKRWLMSDTMVCQAVVDITFNILKYMTETEQDSTMKSFDLLLPSTVERCVGTALAHPHRARAAARAWARGPAAAAALRAAAARLLRRPDCRARSLLLLALSHDPHTHTHTHAEESLVSEETVGEIVLMFSTTLLSASGADATLAHTASVASLLATTLPATTPNYDLLVFSLFRLNLIVHPGVGLPAEAWREVRGAWQDGLVARRAACERAARAAHRHLASDTELNISNIEHAVSLFPYLIDDDSLQSLTALLFRLSRCERSDSSDTTDDSDSSDRSKRFARAAPLELFALRYDCIVGKLNCPFDDDNDYIKRVVDQSADPDVDELMKDEFVLQATDILFRAIYLRTMLVHKVTSDEDDEASEEEQKEQNRCNTLLEKEYLQTEFVKVLRDYMIIDSLHEGYAFWPYYELIEETKSKLDFILGDIIKETSSCLRNKILVVLTELAAKEGYYWSYARSFYESKMTKQEESGSENVAVDIENLADVVTGNGYYHSLQARAWRSSDARLSLRVSQLVALRSARAAWPGRALAAPRGPADAGPLLDLYYAHDDTMLYDRDVSDASWAHVVSNACIAEYLSRLVAVGGWDAPAHHWDFATISLCSLLATLELSKHNWGSAKVAMLCRSTLRLLGSVRAFVGALADECRRRQPAAHVAALAREWADVFAPAVRTSLHVLVLHVLDRHAQPMSCGRARFASALVSAARAPAAELGGAGGAGAGAALRRLCAAACGAWRAPAHRAYHYLAHAAVCAHAAHAHAHDVEELTTWSNNLTDSEEEKPRPNFVITYFNETYHHLLELVDAALSHIEVCAGVCETAARSDARGLARALLLLADAQHAACAVPPAAPPPAADLAHHYIRIFQQEKYTDMLLPQALRLLPAAVLDNALDAAEPGPPLAPHYLHMFNNTREFSIDEGEDGVCGSLACRAVCHALRGPGAGAARGWHAAAAPRVARALAALARRAVSPHAVRAQLREVSARARDLPGVQLAVRPAALEASATLLVDERPLELCVQFARDHPLSPPRVVAPRAGPGAGTHWILVYLGYQNGSLFTALRMWAQAVTARVSSQPQCYICYCRLHPSSGHLPRMYCQQCNNKFHTVCLRKWFATSNKSNCPLCRAAF